MNESFPAEVKYVIEEIALVYKNEERTKAEGMSPEERLRFHQEESKPVMDRLKAFLDDRIVGKKTELLRHPAEIAASPADWMPWYCAATLGRPPPVG